MVRGSLPEAGRGGRGEGSCSPGRTWLGLEEEQNPDAGGREDTLTQHSKANIPVSPRPCCNGLRNPFKEVHWGPQAGKPKPGGQCLEPTSRLASILQLLRSALGP